MRPRPAGAIARADIDDAGMRWLIEQMVACGTRHTLSSWNALSAVSAVGGTMC